MFPRSFQLRNGANPSIDARLGNNFGFLRPVSRGPGAPLTAEGSPSSVQVMASRGDSVPSSSGAADGVKKTMKEEAVSSNREVYDKLISVFRQKDRAEWRKLIAFSKQWAGLADGVFARIDELSREAAGPDEQLALRQMLKSLRTAHTDVKRFNELIKEFRGSPSRQWDGLVASYRADLRPEFFEHVKYLVVAAGQNNDEKETLTALASRVISLIEAYDQVAKDEAAMRDAGARFQDLLQSVESLEDADRKIDQMAETGQLDPAFLLTMAKAYAASKESHLTKPEVMDIMAHLYFKAQETAARQQPVEVRILKYLLSVEDPLQRSTEMSEAFNPGPQFESPTHDYLSTTPDRLLDTIEAVLGAFESQKSRNSLLGETAKMMNPAVIQRLKEMQLEIKKRYS